MSCSIVNSVLVSLCQRVLTCTNSGFDISESNNSCLYLSIPNPQVSHTHYTGKCVAYHFQSVNPKDSDRDNSSLCYKEATLNRMYAVLFF